MAEQYAASSTGLQSHQAFPAGRSLWVAQIRRSAISVPSNIAEGQGRASKGEFRQFLCIARGSLFELETQFLLAKGLGYLSDQEAHELEAAIAEVAPVLSGLIRSLNEKAK